MRAKLSDRQTLLVLIGKRLLEQVPKLLRDSRRRSLLKWQRIPIVTVSTGEYVLIMLIRGSCPLEGRTTSHENKKNNAAGEYILHLPIEALTFENFWCHVALGTAVAGFLDRLQV
jgi:hypothetical protein